MKKLLLALALLLIPASAPAQCNGAFPANSVCGSLAGGIPGQVPTSSLVLPGYALLAGGNAFTGDQSFNISGTTGTTGPFTVFSNNGGTSAASFGAITYAGTGSGNIGGAFHGICVGGSAASPSQCKSGWNITAIGGPVYTGAAFSISSPSAMYFVTDEDQTPTANGSHIDWYTTPIGTALASRVNWMTLTNNGVLQIKGTGTIKVGTGTADANTGAIIQGTVASGGVASLISQVNSITGFNGFHANNSTANVGFFAVVIEPSSTATNFGVADANWTEIVSSGASNNGILFGTLSATPIVLGTNNIEALRVLSAGNVKFTNAANFAANNARTVTISNVGPAAIGATIAKWLTFQDSSGTVSYIPVWQ